MDSGRCRSPLLRCASKSPAIHFQRSHGKREKALPTGLFTFRYKDGELLKEDERHTFYADEDGFFAMTIDPVQVTDTGRYTCVATNEYGQASTSAFFRVLKGRHCARS